MVRMYRGLRVVSSKTQSLQELLRTALLFVALLLHHILLPLFLSFHSLICGFSRSCLFLSYHGHYFFPVSPHHSKVPSKSSSLCLPPLYSVHAMYAFLMEVALLRTYSLLHTTAVVLT